MVAKSKKLLTKSKQAWTKQFKPKVLRGTALNPNLTDALNYKKRLDVLINRMTEDTERQLKELFKSDAAKEFFAMDASLSSQARIITNALIDKYRGMFGKYAKPIAERMVDDVDKSTTTALHFSLEQLSGGLSLKTSALSPATVEVINASVTENVALIKSIPEQYLSGVQQAVMRSITGGQGMSDLLPYLEKEAGVTKRRARIIAYDQTRKAFNAIDVEKMKRLGIKSFEWLHSGGSSEPRKLHQKLSGKIFRLDDPPIIEDNNGKITRGLPGQLINCRCRLLPVITFEDE